MYLNYYFQSYEKEKKLSCRHVCLSNNIISFYLININGMGTLRCSRKKKKIKCEFSTVLIKNECLFSCVGGSRFNNNNTIIGSQQFDTVSVL